MARKINDRVRVASLGLGSIAVEGTITEVHEIPGMPDATEYSVVWDDGEYADEIWSEQDFDQDFEG